MRILIAEDDLTARTILIGLLKKWNYELIVVKDGQAAWDALQQPDAPRLVIMDWMMPGMDGKDVILHVRASDIEPPPYIILLTGKDQRSDILSGLEAGANDYIKKPFDQVELFARIRAGKRSIELQDSLYETQKTLAHLATHDPLTGILNRRAIIEQLSKELSRERRGGSNQSSPSSLRCAIGFFDIDLFKNINDQKGHQIGDEVLKGLVNLIATQLRVYDSFGRLGGDEFLVIAPEISIENCTHLFNRLSTTISEGKIMTSVEPVGVTISLGVALAGPDEEADKFLDRADVAMYQAKRAGGNCVVYA